MPLRAQEGTALKQKVSVVKVRNRQRRRRPSFFLCRSFFGAFVGLKALLEPLTELRIRNTQTYAINTRTTVMMCS